MTVHPKTKEDFEESRLTTCQRTGAYLVTKNVQEVLNTNLKRLEKEGPKTFYNSPNGVK